MRPYPAWLDRFTLPRALSYLRLASHWHLPDRPLLDWGRNQLGLTGSAARKWYRRAWWGLTAGEVVFRKLCHPVRRREVLDLVDEPDWSEFREAHRDHGAVILAAAHIGPPKTAMYSLMEQPLSLLIWTNMRDLPKWVDENSDASFIDPTLPSERRTILLRSALHLRDHGVLLGAPDIPTGRQTTTLERLGTKWTFSHGIPVLARKLDLPVFLVLALWKEHRIGLQYERFLPPPAHLNEDDWHRAWIESYWQKLEPLIRSSPENLRFLRRIDKGRISRELSQGRQAHDLDRATFPRRSVA